MQDERRRNNLEDNKYCLFGSTDQGFKNIQNKKYIKLDVVNNKTKL